MGVTEDTRSPVAEISSTRTAAMSPVLRSTEYSFTRYLGSARRSCSRSITRTILVTVLSQRRRGAMVTSYLRFQSLVCALLRRAFAEHKARHSNAVTQNCLTHLLS